MDRPTQLRGQALPSAREHKEAQNAEALGGMRCPAAAADSSPQALEAGRAVLAVILAAIAERPRLLEPCAARFSDAATTGFLQEDLDWLYQRVIHVLQASGARPASKVSADLLEAWV